MSRTSTPALNPLITIPEAADLLRVCRRTIWRLIKEGRIRTRRIGRRVLIDPSDLEDFLRRS
jgi:putative molybdopterin biosynthesis protein